MYQVNFINESIQVTATNLNKCGLLDDQIRSDPDMIVPFKSIIGLSAFAFKEKYINDPKWYKYKIRKLVSYNKSKCNDVIINLREFAHTYKCDNLLKVLDLIKPVSDYNVHEFFIITKNKLVLTANEIASDILDHDGVQISNNEYCGDTFKEFGELVPRHIVDYTIWLSIHEYLPKSIKFEAFKQLHTYKFSQKHIPYINTVFMRYAGEIKSICKWLDSATYAIHESDDLEPLSIGLYKLADSLIIQGYKLKYRSVLSSVYCDAGEIDDVFKQKRKWLEYKVKK